ncbi:hypothetical protein L6452_33071 [Arctium lappa]|uniref:Uncharacterized protein n=1 Tax=Arctium lappa TaxID=4217 RepID=A0ACB8Z5G6_ARCLA|nr:hypothetical protein L6452_33071 [Arctium lappa]
MEVTEKLLNVIHDLETTHISGLCCLLVVGILLVVSLMETLLLPTKHSTGKEMRRCTTTPRFCSYVLHARAKSRSNNDRHHSLGLVTDMISVKDAVGYLKYVSNEMSKAEALLKVSLSPIDSIHMEHFYFEALGNTFRIPADSRAQEMGDIIIRAVLNDASQKKLTDEYIKWWLNRLQQLVYDVLDVLATEAMDREMNHEGLGAITSKVRKFIPTRCTSFLVSTRMHDKLTDITTKLQGLEKEKVSLRLTVIDRWKANKYE